MRHFEELYRKFYDYVRLIGGGGKPRNVQLIRHAVGIVWNYLLLEFTITDYFELTLYNKSYKEKKKYIGYKTCRRFAEYADSAEHITKYLSKTVMYQEMEKYVKREQLFSGKCSYEEFDSYLSRHPRCMYKPDTLDCGRGIEIWDVSEKTIQVFWYKFIQESAVLDELITQHTAMSKLCDKSVNTVRIFTLKIGERYELIGAALRMGNGSSVVDNYSAGGLVGAVDLQSGKVIAEAENALGKRFLFHPYSKVKIKGFQIPNWPDVLAFVEDCANTLQLNYAAWDIAVCQNGCTLVEVNPNGMANTIQIAGAGGRRKQYQELKKKLEAYRSNLK